MNFGLYYKFLLLIIAIIVGYYRTKPDTPRYQFLEVFANSSMNWNTSTTPIPISAPSVILKAILAKKEDKVPEELRKWMEMDTIEVDIVRQYLNRDNSLRLKQLCTENPDYCKKMVLQRDPEFGMTPLHLASAEGDIASIEYLRSIGAKDNVVDRFGRKPFNLTFKNFIVNSKRFALEANRPDCDLPTVVLRSPEDFKEVKRLVGEGEPVLIKNAKDFLEKEIKINFNLKELVDLHGDSTVTVGEVPYANVFRLQHKITTLQDYYSQHVEVPSEQPLYIFQKNNNITKEGLEFLSEMVKQMFPSPSIICPIEYGNSGYDSIHYFLGAKNSGAPLHIHADALNLITLGQKKWFIYPPLQALYSRKHISQWLVEDYPKLENKPLECIQEVGDVIYVPFDWSHAVINLADQTFGYALELLNRRTTMISLPSRYQSC